MFFRIFHLQVEKGVFSCQMVHDLSQWSVDFHMIVNKIRRSWTPEVNAIAHSNCTLTLIMMRADASKACKYLENDLLVDVVLWGYIFNYFKCFSNLISITYDGI